MHYEISYGGGLGDIFWQLYEHGSYNIIRDLGDNDTADVFLCTHNPHVRELFDYHPKAKQLTIHDPGYWGPEENEAMCIKHGFPLKPAPRPVKDSYITFHTSPADKLVTSIDKVEGKEYIVLAAGAGEQHRSIPPEIIEKIVAYVLANSGYYIVVVGRNYDRWGRKEPEIAENERIINCVDKLSVPCTARFVQEATGLITAHSALNLLGWCEKIPQLLLYPQSVLDRHAPDGKYDHWMFGADRPNTIHGKFEDYTDAMCERFLGVL